ARPQAGPDCRCRRPAWSLLCVSPFVQFLLDILWSEIVWSRATRPREVRGKVEQEPVRQSHPTSALQQSTGESPADTRSKPTPSVLRPSSPRLARSPAI